MSISFDGNGLVTQNLNEILNETYDQARSLFGNAFKVDKDPLLRNLISIGSEREVLIHELIQAIISNLYLPTAEGNNLDLVAQIIGTTRQPATSSTVLVFVRGTPSQAIAANTLKITVELTGESFTNLSAATLDSQASVVAVSVTQSAGVATVTMASNPFADDEFVFIRSANETGYNLLAKVDNSTGTTFTYPVDSGLASPATGAITIYKASPVLMTSGNTGPIAALANTLNNITGAVTGVTEANNFSDATLGRNLETDTEFRARTKNSVSIAGGGFREAIITKLLNVLSVNSATLFENNRNTTDAGGRPAGSVECFVEGGTDVNVSVGVVNSVSAGVRMFGNTEETYTDSQGEEVIVGFSRLVKVEIYVDVTVTTNTDAAQGPTYPVDGDAQIETALAAITFDAGFDVWESTLRKAVTSIAGVVDVTSLTFAKTASPINTATIAIVPTEFANVDSANVNVTSS
jgi:uncharacterized phage protein gp47/JayE